MASSVAHRRSCSSEADLVVADEYSTAHSRATGAATSVAGHGMATQVEVSARRQKEQYDPRDPAYVTPASDLEVAEAEARLLNQQLAGFRSMLARREKSDPGSPLVQDYRRRAEEMQRAVEAAEAQKEALSPKFQRTLGHKRIDSDGSSASTSASTASVTSFQGV